MSDSEQNVAELVNSEPHDFRSLLSSSGRDFLVRNNGDQVYFHLSIYDCFRLSYAVPLGLCQSPLDLS